MRMFMRGEVLLVGITSLLHHFGWPSSESFNWFVLFNSIICDEKWYCVVPNVSHQVFAFIVLVLTAYSSNAFGGSPDGSIAVNDLVIRSRFDSGGRLLTRHTQFPGYSMSYFTFTWTVLFLIYVRDIELMI